MNTQQIVPDDVPMRVAVTGGCGFIGSHFVDELWASGREVVVIDDLSTAGSKERESMADRDRIELLVEDLAHPVHLESALAGVGLVIHLAANADMRIGLTNTMIDIDTHVLGTRNLCEAMRANDIGRLLFASTGAVYGCLSSSLVSESSGPLQPQSLYGAGKLSAEAFIAAYCELFDLRSIVFRFGNILGSRMPRGAIRDFVAKLRADPTRLEVLGDGSQHKSYLLVEECIEGMLRLNHNDPLSDSQPCRIINLGASGSTGILEIAGWVAEAMELEPPELQIEGSATAWPGDQPHVLLDVSLAASLGWQARRSSHDAAREGARRMVAWLVEEPG